MFNITFIMQVAGVDVRVTAEHIRREDVTSFCSALEKEGRTVIEVKSI